MSKIASDFRADRTPDWSANDNSTFYTVEMFALGELVAIRFFERHQMLDAKRSALAGVSDCTFDEAQVRDDRGRLIFRPGPPGPATC